MLAESMGVPVQEVSDVLDDGSGSCGCENREDDFPPGAGFAFRREGASMSCVCTKRSRAGKMI